MNTQDTHYFDGQLPLTGYLAEASNQRIKRPGILLIHGGAGLDEHARNRARLFASSGYLVHACDMYGDGVAGDRQRVMARLAELRSNRDMIVKRAQAGIDVLRSDPRSDGRIAVVGYCFGGMVALELARAGGLLAGVVSVHGSLMGIKPAENSEVKAKILVCHGALDPHVPITQVTDFIAEMNRAEADWQMAVYGGAAHGFTHENAAVYKDPGVAYDATADARSMAAIGQFLQTCFGS